MVSLLSTIQVAEYCGVHQTTVIRWIDAGRLPAQKTPGGHRRIQTSDLVAFMKSHSMPIPDSLQGEAAAGSRVRVVVVDDDPRVLKTLVAALEKFPKLFQAQGYQSGVQALLEMAADPPDALVLDLAMPGVDGYEVIRQVRQSRLAQLAEIDIVVVTGLDLEEVEADALEAGALVVLQKPVSSPELQEALLAARLRGQS